VFLQQISYQSDSLKKPSETSSFSTLHFQKASSSQVFFTLHFFFKSYSLHLLNLQNLLFIKLEFSSSPASTSTESQVLVPNLSSQSLESDCCRIWGLILLNMARAGSQFVLRVEFVFGHFCFSLYYIYYSLC
jgi:hypothetical protein